jgi:hypothetical protein
MSNGLSDHEAQLFTEHLPVSLAIKNELLVKRNISDNNMAEFNLKLSYENWESVFNNCDINTCFNQFLNKFLRHFYESFPKTIRHKYKQKLWATTGIKISCNNKRALYDEANNSNNPTLHNYYKKYCSTIQSNKSSKEDVI